MGRHNLRKKGRHAVSKPNPLFVTLTGTVAAGALMLPLASTASAAGFESVAPQPANEFAAVTQLAADSGSTPAPKAEASTPAAPVKTETKTDAKVTAKADAKVTAKADAKVTAKAKQDLAAPKPAAVWTPPEQVRSLPAPASAPVAQDEPAPQIGAPAVAPAPETVSNKVATRPAAPVQGKSASGKSVQGKSAGTLGTESRSPSVSSLTDFRDPGIDFGRDFVGNVGAFAGAVVGTTLDTVFQNKENQAKQGFEGFLRTVGATVGSVAGGGVGGGLDGAIGGVAGANRGMAKELADAGKGVGGAVGSAAGSAIAGAIAAPAAPIGGAIGKAAGELGGAAVGGGAAGIIDGALAGFEDATGGGLKLFGDNGSGGFDLFGGNGSAARS